jgi:hypothetical protein
MMTPPQLGFAIPGSQRINAMPFQGRLAGETFPKHCGFGTLFNCADSPV